MNVKESVHARPTTDAPVRQRQLVQSVARASQILLIIAGSRDGMTASEVAAEMGLALPTTYHLLATLEHERLLSKAPNKRYLLGAAAADIANSRGLRSRVDPQHRLALKQLAGVTQETAYLTGWFRGEIRILATVEGSRAVRVGGLEVGQTHDVHARASAKVLLAYAEEEQRANILDRQEFTRFTPMTVGSRAALELQLEEIRRTGIFYDKGEYQDDVRSVSAPIRRGGQVIAALAVTSPANRYERSEAHFTAALKAAVTFAEG